MRVAGSRSRRLAIQAVILSPARIMTVEMRITMPMTMTLATAMSFFLHHGRVSCTS
jgi:hypothetical protein